MKKLYFILISALVSLSLFAQTPQKETNSSSHQDLPSMSIYSWKITPKLGNENRINVDTVPLDFQEYNTGDGYRSPRGYLGNLGSPSYSRIFFSQNDIPRFIFARAYEPFLLSPDKVPFFNTTIPLMNITYLSGGSKTNGEERFKALFTANRGKRLNLGAGIDYIYARGFYEDQAVKNFTYKLFGSYNSDKYILQAYVGNNNLSNQENGGISDDRYITNPATVSSGSGVMTSNSIPTRLEKTWNQINQGTAFLNHRYNIGFYKKEKKDTIESERFIPVTSIIHTLEYNKFFRRYIAKSSDTAFAMYKNTFLSNAGTNDTTKYTSFRNTFAISLLEGFNKYALFGLTAYIQNEFRQYRLMRPLADSSSYDKYTEQSTFLGAELSRRNGKTINYIANAEVCVLGADLGQTTLSGQLFSSVKIFGKTVQFMANGYIKNVTPAYYLNHYFSNHFQWNQSLKDERRVRLEGELALPGEHFSLKGGVENLQNHIYFNNDAIPVQKASNIQVISACLSKDFKWGKLHLDNEIYGQFSSDEKVIPLPALSLYHNLYLKTKIAGVLTLQTGFNVRYHSEYYAQTYNPAISQFIQQDDNDKVLIGGYPLVNAYANLHLKRTRFFINYYHANQGLTGTNYFSTPHYPINPRVMKIGVSWNFNN